MITWFHSGTMLPFKMPAHAEGKIVFPVSSMVLDGNSEDAAHACKKIGLFGEKISYV